MTSSDAQFITLPKFNFHIYENINPARERVNKMLIIFNVLYISCYILQSDHGFTNYRYLYSMINATKSSRKRL